MKLRVQAKKDGPARETFSITCQAFANRMTSATVFVLRARYRLRFGSFQVAYLDFLSFFLSFYFFSFFPRESSKTDLSLTT